MITIPLTAVVTVVVVVPNIDDNVDLDRDVLGPTVEDLSLAFLFLFLLLALPFRFLFLFCLLFFLVFLLLLDDDLVFFPRLLLFLFRRLDLVSGLDLASSDMDGVSGDDVVELSVAELSADSTTRNPRDSLVESETNTTITVLTTTIKLSIELL